MTSAWNLEDQEKEERNVKANIIAGGLISTNKHLENAFAHGAIACSTSESSLWR